MNTTGPGAHIQETSCAQSPFILTTALPRKPCDSNPTGEAMRSYRTCPTLRLEGEGPGLKGAFPAYPSSPMFPTGTYLARSGTHIYTQSSGGRCLGNLSNSLFYSQESKAKVSGHRPMQPLCPVILYQKLTMATPLEMEKPGSEGASARPRSHAQRAAELESGPSFSS